jgi:hypothetical protein
VGRWNSNYQRNAPCMNLDSQQLWLNLWTWGLDVQNSTLAVIHANDAVALTRMADDLIAGTVQPSREVLQALEQRTDLPVQAAYRLAERFAEFCGFAWRVCTHQDATSDMLDALTGRYLAIPLLADHPNLKQSTIDRLVVSGMASGDANYELVDRASLPVLEALMSQDAPDLIRNSVARRTRDKQLLRKLAVDPDQGIRRNVVSNLFADAELVSEIVRRDDDVSVLIGAARRTTNREDLNFLAARLCEIKLYGLAKAIRENPHASDAAKAAAVMIDTDYR